MKQCVLSDLAFCSLLSLSLSTIFGHRSTPLWCFFIFAHALWAWRYTLVVFLHFCPCFMGIEVHPCDVSSFCPHILSIMICQVGGSMRYCSTRSFLSFHHSCYVFKSSTCTAVLLSMPLSIPRLPALIEIADAEPPYPWQEHRGHFLLSPCSPQDRISAH